MLDNAAFSDVVNYWGSKLEEKEKKEYYEFLKISNLLKHYENGETHVWHRYWTKTALFEPMLAEQHIVMFDDEENGDVLAISYVLDQTEKFRIISGNPRQFNYRDESVNCACLHS